MAAHGTANEEGRQVIERCAAAAAAELGVAHAVGYVDVCGPTLEEVLSTSMGGDPVVVPFFLASGYHVRHDVPGAVSAVPGSTVTPALGVEPEVLAALADRVLEVLPHADGVVVTGAGSSVDGARAEVARAAELLGERLGVATGTAFLSGPGPRPPEEVARLRDAGSLRIALASHLLAPGHFLDRARDAALELGRVASGPLGTHPALIDLVVRRYREAVGERPPQS